MKLFYRTLIYVLFIAIFIPSAQAQTKYERFKDKKYIFLLDITKSMFGCCGAEDIFDDVRDHLIKAISNIPDEKAEIVISTYQEEIIDSWEARATVDGKKQLITQLNNIYEKGV